MCNGEPKGREVVADVFMAEREAVTFLEEELIKLTVKCSSIVSNEKPMLLCMVWSKKSYNSDRFRVQMKSLWKVKKKFDIQIAGQNLFLIIFENDDDLETILEGRP